MAGQQLLMLHVLFVDNWVCKVAQVSLTVFFAHFEGIENMYLLPGNADLLR